MIPSIIFCGLVYSHDHLLLNGDRIWKNIVNGFVYMTYYDGSLTLSLPTKTVGSPPCEPRIVTALCLSRAIIWKNIHVQDLTNVEGDLKMGRQTTVIYLGQDLARLSILVSSLVSGHSHCRAYGEQI